MIFRLLFGSEDDEYLGGLLASCAGERKSDYEQPQTYGTRL
jgi:hypothetical protein